MRVGSRKGGATGYIQSLKQSETTSCGLEVKAGVSTDDDDDDDGAMCGLHSLGRMVLYRFLVP